jgi:hypothetical protein
LRLRAGMVADLLPSIAPSCASQDDAGYEVSLCCNSAPGE